MPESAATRSCTVEIRHFSSSTRHGHAAVGATAAVSSSRLTRATRRPSRRSSGRPLERDGLVAGAEVHAALDPVEVREQTPRSSSTPSTGSAPPRPPRPGRMNEKRQRKLRARRAQALLGDLEHLGIAIQPDQQAVGAEPLPRPRRGPVGAVRRWGVGPRRQELEHFGDHRRMRNYSPRRASQEARVLGFVLLRIRDLGLVTRTRSRSRRRRSSPGT